MFPRYFAKFCSKFQGFLVKRNVRQLPPVFPSSVNCVLYRGLLILFENNLENYVVLLFSGSSAHNEKQFDDDVIRSSCDPCRPCDVLPWRHTWSRGSQLPSRTHLLAGLFGQRANHAALWSAPRYVVCKVKESLSRVKGHKLTVADTDCQAFRLVNEIIVLKWR